MGSSNTDYRQQIDTSLAQANLPKSPLAQQYSNLFGNASPGLMNSLMNIQSLGNSFINSNGASASYQPQTSSTNGPFGAGPVGGNQNQNNNAYGGLFNGVGNHQYDMNPQAGQSFAPADNTIGFYNDPMAGGSNPLFRGGGGNDMNPDAGQFFSPAIFNLSPRDPTNRFSPGGGVGGAGGGPTGGGGGIIGGGGLPGGGRLSPTDPNQPLFTGGSTVNTTNGLPSGINIPNLNTAYQGNPAGAINGLGNAVNNSGSMLEQILRMSPGALQNMGQNNGASLGMNNTMQQIQQLLNQVGGGYQNVQTSNVNNPNFSQQLAQPQNVNANFNPEIAQPGQVGTNFNQQQANPGSVNANFNATQADLSGVPNSTQLSSNNSQAFDAINQLLNQQNTKNIADIREQSLQTGQANSSGEDYATSVYRAQEAPQLASALENVRNQEVGNQLNQANLQQTGLLANAGMSNQYGLGGAELGANTGLANIQNQLNAINLNNQYGLGGAQLGSNTALQNVQNYLTSISQNNQAGLGAATLGANTGLQNQQNQMNAANLNNLTALQARGQDVGTSLANASNAINVGQGNQAAGLQNQNQNNSLLNNLLSNQLGQGNLNLQNFFQTIGANQNQMGINNQYSNSNVSANNSLATLLSGLNQFNAGQGNQYNLATGGMNQQAAQFQISNQLSQLASLFGQGMGMASQGIPGGSANVNIGNSNPQGSGLGGTLGGLGELLGALRGFGGQ